MPSYKRKPKGSGKNGKRDFSSGSSTPGSSKGENCQATPMERIYCGRNRSYKYPGYVDWLKKTRSR